MTKERMRVVIAEWMGWKSERDPYYIDRLRWRSPDGAYYGTCDLPDFPNDLNAIHEAEKGLDEHDADTNIPIQEANWRSRYSIALVRITNKSNPFDATALQRCEALLRTIGRWEEDAK